MKKCIKTSILSITILLTGFSVTGQNNTLNPTGNVGINFPAGQTPQTTFHALGKSRFDLTTASGAGFGRMYLTRTANVNQECLLSFGTNGTAAYDWTMGTYANATANNDFILNAYTSGRAMTILQSNGFIGLGLSSNPLSKLQIGGNTLFSTASTTLPAGSYSPLIKSTAGGVTYSYSPDYSWFNDEQTGLFHPALGVVGFSKQGVEVMRVHSNGYVGIGTASPTAKFEVSGGDSRFDSNNKLYIPSAGDSYFWKGTDGINNVKLSVWDKFTIYNPTMAGLNTNNGDWNIQMGARDGSINTKGGANFAIAAGNVGIGTANPTEHLQIGDRFVFHDGGTKYLGYNSHYDGVNNVRLVNGFSSILAFGANGDVSFSTAVSGTPGSVITYVTPLTIQNNGNVSIGDRKAAAPHSNARLSVDGKILATSIYVNISSWADYVFSDDYVLPKLSDIEAYYKLNKHLPEIPSEKEVLENGINVAEMNELLLKKVEELTILMVEQNKEIEKLKAAINTDK